MTTSPTDPFDRSITPEPSVLPAPPLGDRLPQYGQYATGDQMPMAPASPAFAGQQTLAPRTNTIAVVALVLSFFMALPALICGIIGLNKSKELGGTGRGMSIAAIIISLASMLLAGILVIWMLNTGAL